MGGGTDMQRTLFKIISLSAGTARERESGEKMKGQEHQLEKGA